MIRPSNVILAAFLCIGLAMPRYALGADAAQPAAAPSPAPPAPISPPTPEVQGAYGDWSLYQYEENGYPVCYLASRFMKSSESVPGRTPAFVLVTNRPGEAKWHVVSVVSGYPYQDGSGVMVAIGRRQFHLFTDNDTAWAEDAADPLIVQAIHGGASLSVSGHMKDGPAITDSFSLKGAAEALAALDKACPEPGKPGMKATHKKRKKPK